MHTGARIGMPARSPPSITGAPELALLKSACHGTTGDSCGSNEHIARIEVRLPLPILFARHVPGVQDSSTRHNAPGRPSRCPVALRVRPPPYWTARTTCSSRGSGTKPRCTPRGKDVGAAALRRRGPTADRTKLLGLAPGSGPTRPGDSLFEEG